MRRSALSSSSARTPSTGTCARSSRSWRSPPDGSCPRCSATRRSARRRPDLRRPRTAGGFRDRDYAGRRVRGPRTTYRPRTSKGATEDGPAGGSSQGIADLRDDLDGSQGMDANAHDLEYAAVMFLEARPRLLDIASRILESGDE